MEERKKLCEEMMKLMAQAKSYGFSFEEAFKDMDAEMTKKMKKYWDMI